jgi:hypothetical protein
MPTVQRASALLALQQTHGNRYVQRVVRGIQAKLKIGQPGDIYEQEADRVADEVMRMPEPKVKRQAEEEKEEEEKEKEEILQTKEVPSQIPEVTSEFESSIQSLKDGGQPLPKSARAFFEPRFGQDFSRVRAHTDAQAAETAQTLNARAFTMGHDIVFGAGQYVPGTSEGRRLMAHELTHVMQQASSTVIQRDPNNISSIDRLRQLLQDNEEDEAIELMGRLSAEEVQAVLMSREFKELAMDAFNNGEMYRGIRAMRGDLYRSLEWMFDEGTDWGKVRDVITRAPSGKDRIRTDNWMKDQFVGICNDEEMAEAVSLLGGTLLQQLTWMKAEGSSWSLVKASSNWSLVKARIQATTDAAQKRTLYSNSDLREFFVDVCNDEEMAEAVSLLGGTLLQQLTWMKAEGSNWDLVKTKLQDSTIPQTEKTDLYNHDSMKNFFVSVCNDEEMAEAVDSLQGTLLQKLRWMAAEGSNWDLVKTKIEATTTSAAEKLDLYNHDDMRDFFVDVCNNKTIIIATRLLGGTWAQKTAWMEAEGVTAPVAGEMEEMLGEEATWVPSGPGSANTFESWASAPTEGTAPPLKKSTTINCWEMVLLAAYRCGVIDWNWINNLYTAVSPSAWVSRMASSTTTYVPGTSTLSRGDLVFFNGLAHVALATGEGDKIYTFWPPPDKPSSIGTIDEVKISTIKALSDYMTPIWGTPVVTFGTPTW